MQSPEDKLGKYSHIFRDSWTTWCSCTWIDIFINLSSLSLRNSYFFWSYFQKLIVFLFTNWIVEFDYPLQRQLGELYKCFMAVNLRNVDWIDEYCTQLYIVTFDWCSFVHDKNVGEETDVNNLIWLTKEKESICYQPINKQNYTIKS